MIWILNTKASRRVSLLFRIQWVDSMIITAHFSIPRAPLPTSKRITALFQCCKVIPVSERFIRNKLQSAVETVLTWESGDLNFTYDWLVKKPSARSLYLWALVYDFVSDKKQLSIFIYLKEIKKYLLTCLLRKEHKTILREDLVLEYMIWSLLTQPKKCN